VLLAFYNIDEDGSTMYAGDDESFFRSGSKLAEPEIEHVSGGSRSILPLLQQLKCHTASDLSNLTHL